MPARNTNALQQTDPPSVGYAVAQSNTVDDPNGPFRAISVAAAGDVKATMIGGVDVTFFVAAGIQFSGFFKRIWTTGTTATSIIGWK